MSDDGRKHIRLKRSSLRLFYLPPGKNKSIILLFNAPLSCLFVLTAFHKTIIECFFTMGTNSDMAPVKARLFRSVLCPWRADGRLLTVCMAADFSLAVFRAVPDDISTVTFTVTCGIS
jgi:hypothetical protein